jgi:RNA polymerase sigma-70 factor (family 1)
LDQKRHIKSLLLKISYDNDEKAFKQLFDLFAGRLFRFSKSFLKNEPLAEEAVSDVFFRFWLHRSSLSEHSNIKAYLFKAAYHTSLNYLNETRRKKAISLEDIDVDLGVDHICPETDLINKELKGIIEQAIDSLPPRCKLIYQMAKVEQMKYKEIAALLNISVKTIDHQLTIAVRKIGEVIRHYLQEDETGGIHVHVKGNRVERTGRNGIIIRYVVNPIVEYNVVAYSSRFDTGHSIFNFNTIGCIVQYNEAYGNTSSNPDDTDHGGFDADYNSRGTVIQYNYSHDNNWFCGIMRRGINTDVTIRYNISQNELLGAYLYGFPTEKGLKDVKIYNNTHYFGKGKGTRIFVSAGKERIPIETTFRNNIFFFEDCAEWGFEPDASCSFENNLFLNVSPLGTGALTADPLFTAPGTGGTDIDMHDTERLSGYRLPTGSPALGAGVKINDNGNKNFGGNSLSEEIANIGAW